MFKHSSSISAVAVMVCMACTHTNESPMTPANGTTNERNPPSGHPGMSDSPPSDIDDGTKGSPGVPGNPDNDIPDGSNSPGSGNRTNDHDSSGPVPGATSGSGTGAGSRSGAR